MNRIFRFITVLFVVSLIVSSFTSLASAEESALEVIDIKIAKDIVEREPVGISDTFPSTINKLYCFSRIKVDMEATTIYHSWYYNDEKVTQIELNVKKSPGFRTYSSKTITENQKGKWEVEVIDGEGNVLKSITFTIN